MLSLAQDTPSSMPANGSQGLLWVHSKTTLTFAHQASPTPGVVIW